MVTVPLSPAAAVAAPPHPWVAALLSSLSPAAGPAADSLADLRRRLATTPLPSRRQEDWRFTDPSPITAITPQRLTAEPPAALPQLREGHCRVLLHGTSVDPAAIRWPAGIEPLTAEAIAGLGDGSLSGPDASADWPALLNGSCPPSLLALRVSGPVPGVLELVSDPGSAVGILPLRVVLLLEPGAKLSLLQVHRADGPSLTSVQVQAVLGKGAELDHGLLASGSSEAVLLAGLSIRQQPESRWSLTSVTSGWGLVRQEPRVVQSSGAAETLLRSLQLVDDRQLADTHSRVRFDGPDGRLDQLHKVVADGRGRSVFNGAVCVPRQAQRTDASQLSRSLLLSDRARVDTKPELEIVADDVRCAHGATVSRLQEEELFYLRSRGIAGAEAARLLLRGYCQEIIDALPAAGASWPVPSFLPGPEAGR